MSNPIKKTMVYLGLADEEQSYDAAPAATVAPVSAGRAQVTPLRAKTPARGAAAVDMNEIVTVHPKQYSDAKVIAENFREGVPVIMNLSQMTETDARRLIDFASALSKLGIEIVSTGGTGLTGRDVTPEALERIRQINDGKDIPGFGELFRWISYGKIGTSAIQTRATAGVAGATYIFCLPGSPGACRDAWDDILLFQLDSRHRPCNLVELMPRLQEHQKRK